MSRPVRVALALSVAATIARGLAWGIALPPWQGPDEPAHASYVDQLAHGRFPPARPAASVPSRAVVRSLARTGFEEFRFRDPARPFTPALARAVRAREPHAAPASAGHLGGAARYPPAYYAAVLPAWWLGGTPEQSLALGRAVSALLAGLLAYLTFRLVLELTARPPLALVGSLLVGLPPLVGQASGILSPDILLAAGVAGLALACVRRRAGPVAAWWVLLALTKPIGAGVATIVVAAFLGGPLLRRLGNRGRGALLAVGLAVVSGAAVYLASASDRRHSVGDVVRYFGHFYTPRPSAGVWDTWVRSGLGRFGWLSVSLPAWAFGLAVAAIVVPVLVVALAPRAAPLAPRARAAAWSCVLATAAYVLLLNAIEAYTLVHPHGEMLLQGRYLTAVAPLAVTALLVAASRLPARTTVALSVGVCAAWLVVSLAALDTVVRYFAA